MAIIKCPECGHQISDKAETCPICGVKIKGNVVKCPQCGNVYLKDQAMCPVCHYTAVAGSKPQITGSESQPANANQTSLLQNETTADPTKPQKSIKRLIISLIIAVIVIIGGGFWYAETANALHGDEQTAYLNAMQSSDPAVLQDYLDSFKDAPQEHIDSIQAHLNILKMNDTEWTNALISNSKSALMQYMENHPNSIHQTEALHKIDSIDWAMSLKQNTPDAFQAYLNDHPNGEHAVDAQSNIEKLASTTVSPDDKQFVNSVFQQFFRGINNNDEMGVTSAVSSTLHFLTNPSATKQDVISFLHKLYKDDVKSLVWRSNNDFKIQKKNTEDNNTEYDVEFTVDESVSNIDSSKDKFNQYRVKGHIDSDGKISSLQLIKIG